jgi:hypothetical protein
MRASERGRGEAAVALGAPTKNLECPPFPQDTTRPDTRRALIQKDKSSEELIKPLLGPVSVLIFDTGTARESGAGRLRLGRVVVGGDVEDLGLTKPLCDDRGVGFIEQAARTASPPQNPRLCVHLRGL